MSTNFCDLLGNLCVGGVGKVGSRVHREGTLLTEACVKRVALALSLILLAACELDVGLSNTDAGEVDVDAGGGIGVECEVNPCENGATCTSSYDGTCVARASEGEECETNHWDPFGSNCSEDLRCEYGDSGYECMALREAGESCDSNDDCVEGLICEWSESGDVCQELRHNGASCDSDGDCVSGICNGRINRCVAEPDCVRL